MGCFLVCFGSSKDKKRRKQRNKILLRDQRHDTVSSEQDISEEAINPVSELRDNPEEQLSLSTRKRVTFDSAVKTYEPVSVHESRDFGVDSDKASEKENGENYSKYSQSHSLSEDDSVTSSTGSYPPNHRYQNCRDSDDEVEELDDENSDLDDEELGEYEDCDEDGDGDIRIVGGEVWSESIPAVSMESRTELESPMTVSGLGEREVKSLGLPRKARDRSVYVHPVLNPVENLTQWKAVKSKGTPPLKSNKENCTTDQEAVPIPFSSEPSFKEGFKSKSKQSKNLNREIAVDTSLSNWLVSPETAPTKSTSSTGLETITFEKSISQGSNSPWSIEDRPILGALTVEELRQFSASSSPRRSPSRSPDEMPIIGTVGTYWNHTGGQAKNSGSVSAYKGKTNTTSKYREACRIRE
ncbi:uncharacterized protein LOC132269075 [Cornus florida]|uniref:uncharacterized protein LOC132269075 n=1 Tax=Cornus florida TaxID=4283 RepID=UPI00289BF692|nr:uncharacterized protein LOC132269075 [Cornus florida]